MTRDDLIVLTEPLRQSVEAVRKSSDANGAALAEASEKLEARNKEWRTSIWGPAVLVFLSVAATIVANHVWPATAAVAR